MKEYNRYRDSDNSHHKIGYNKLNPKESYLGMETYGQMKDYFVKGQPYLYDKWIVSFHEPVISELEIQFNELASKWKAETGVFSTTIDKINNSYLDIIGLGKDALPFILKDMQTSKGTAHWHTALKAISKENPVPLEEMNKTKRIKELWIEWGKRKNLIKD